MSETDTANPSDPNEAGTTTTEAPLLDIQNLRVRFDTPEGAVRAVDGVDVAVRAGEILGIVGESGSGKSVLNLTVMGLVRQPPGRIESGQILFRGTDLLTLSPEKMRQLRGDRIAMIFQDPMTSLNPFLTIGDQVGEPFVVHRGTSKKAARSRAIELLSDVGIPDPASRIDAFPHQFSGGMRQRVMIAMALALEPDLLIADEPTTALDVTIQAQILELLGEIRRRRGTTIILVTHDLGVVAGFCDQVAVMYAGRVVERGATGEIFRSPGHPYTEALLRSSPRLDDDSEGKLFSIPGRPPDLSAPPQGCSFHPRCPYVFDRCRQDEPELEAFSSQGDSSTRQRACFVEPKDMGMDGRGGTSQP